MKQTKILITIMALLSSTGAFAGSFFSPDVLPALNSVQEAYASGDYSTMVKGVHDILVNYPNDTLLKENVMKLWAGAKQSNSALPSDWMLPKEMKKMQIYVRHGRSDETNNYSIKVGGTNVSTALMKQMRVVRYSDQTVIIDKNAKIGNIDDTQHQGLGFLYESPRTHTAFETGLYLLSFELTTGTKVDNAWFIIDEDMNATAFPELLTPAVGESFQTGTPTFRWNDFHSPQYKPYESRSTWFAVSTSPQWDVVYSYYETSPTLDQITIGSAVPNSEGVSSLDHGNYTFTLSYTELSGFGEVSMGRMCVTTHSFEVK